MLPNKSFSLSGAKIATPKKETSKLTQDGAHLCVVTALREKFGYKGHGFWLDYTVIEGPSGSGLAASKSFYPESNRTAQGRLSAEEVYQRELGKLVLMFAATCGLDANQAGRIQDHHIPLLCQVVDKRADGAYMFPNRIAPSPVVGRLIVVTRKSYGKKDRTGNLTGETSSYEEFAPYSAASYPQFVAAADTYYARSGVVAAPELGDAIQEDEPVAPPPPPKKGPGFKNMAARVAEAGFVVHESDADFYWNETTDEVVEREVLHARLA